MLTQTMETSEQVISPGISRDISKQSAKELKFSNSVWLKRTAISDCQLNQVAPHWSQFGPNWKKYKMIYTLSSSSISNIHIDIWFPLSGKPAFYLPQVAFIPLYNFNYYLSPSSSLISWVPCCPSFLLCVYLRKNLQTVHQYHSTLLPSITEFLCLTWEHWYPVEGWLLSLAWLCDLVTKICHFLVCLKRKGMCVLCVYLLAAKHS